MHLRNAMHQNWWGSPQLMSCFKGLHTSLMSIATPSGMIIDQFWFAFVRRLLPSWEHIRIAFIWIEKRIIFEQHVWSSLKRLLISSDLRLFEIYCQPVNTFISVGIDFKFWCHFSLFSYNCRHMFRPIGTDNLTFISRLFASKNELYLVNM